MMKPFEVSQKARAKPADLAAGENDPVLGFERRADLFALPVVEKALQTDVNHDVVANNATRRNKIGERRFPADEPATSPTSGRT